MTEQSLLAAVSGIQANQTYLDSIANNIANVNTVGYKASEVQFQDLLAQQTSAGVAPATGSGGINPMAIGSGVTVAANQLNLSEGGIQSTGVPTDVAIQGGGYLVVQSGGQQLYTRNGALSTDATGNLTTSSGGLVLGWPANANGTVNTAAPLGPLAIPTGATIGAQPTTELTLGGNLPDWSGTGAAPAPVTTQYNAYDSLGNVVQVALTFTPVTGTANEWTMTGTAQSASGGTATNLFGTTGVTVQFDPTTGQLSKAGTTTPTAGTPTSLTVATMPSGFPTTDTWKINFPATGSSNQVTQYASAPSLQIQSGDGAAAGTLKSYNISQNGTITGSFSNAKTMVLGQIALAGFANAGGLTEQGNGMFATSGNSGQALIGAPGTGALGTLLGGQLEQSNVDLGTELTNLITAQEAYTANTKVLTTTDASLQALEQVP